VSNPHIKPCKKDFYDCEPQKARFFLQRKICVNSTSAIYPCESKLQGEMQGNAEGNAENYSPNAESIENGKEQQIQQGVITS
jgi:hypothetical protein